MMSDMPLEICRAFNERWNNKFYYKVASCLLFLLIHLISLLLLGYEVLLIRGTTLPGLSQWPRRLKRGPAILCYLLGEWMPHSYE
jgi:hypothetical protein